MTNSFHLKLRILLYSSVADLQCRLLHYCQYVGFTLGGPYTYRYSTSCHCGYATPAIMSSCLHRRCVVHNDCNILMRHRSAIMSALRICHLPITNTYIHEFKCLINMSGKCGEKAYIQYMYSRGTTTVYNLHVFSGL